MSSKSLIYLALIPLIALGIYVTIKFKSFQKKLVFIKWFILFESCIQIIGAASSLLKVQNLWLLTVYSPVSTLIFLGHYQKMTTGFINRVIFRLLNIAVVIAFLIDIIYLKSNERFDFATATFRSVILLILALTTSIFLMNEEVRLRQKQLIDSFFWINAGVLVYHASSIMLLYFGPYIMHMFPETYGSVWGLHAVFITIMYVCFFIGLWKSPKQ